MRYELSFAGPWPLERYEVGHEAHFFHSYYTLLEADSSSWLVRPCARSSRSSYRFSPSFSSSSARWTDHGEGLYSSERGSWTRVLCVLLQAMGPFFRELIVLLLQLGDVLAVISLCSTGLRSSSPLPQITPCPFVPFNANAIARIFSLTDSLHCTPGLSSASSKEDTVSASTRTSRTSGTTKRSPRGSRPMSRPTSSRARPISGSRAAAQRRTPS